MLSHPASFYHYESLLPYGFIQIRSKPLSDKALRDLKKLFVCDYSDMGKTKIILCLFLIVFPDNLTSLMSIP